MVNKQKVKGTNWEREFVKLLESIKGVSAKRIASSGAIGTILKEPALFGDVVFTIDDFPKKFRVECKTGYGGESQMTLKREWFDKIKAEADASFSYSMVALKFSNVREKGKTRYVIAFDFDTFSDFISYVVDIKAELDKLYEAIQKPLGSN